MGLRALVIFVVSNVYTNVTNIILLNHMNSTRPTTTANFRACTVTTSVVNKADFFKNGNGVFKIMVNNLVVNIVGFNVGVLSLSDALRRIMVNTLVVNSITLSQFMTGGGWPYDLGRMFL